MLNLSDETRWKKKMLKTHTELKMPRGNEWNK